MVEPFDISIGFSRKRSYHSFNCKASDTGVLSEEHHEVAKNPEVGSSSFSWEQSYLLDTILSSVITGKDESAKSGWGQTGRKNSISPLSRRSQNSTLGKPHGHKRTRPTSCPRLRPAFGRVTQKRVSATRLYFFWTGVNPVASVLPSVPKRLFFRMKPGGPSSMIWTVASGAGSVKSTVRILPSR